MTICLNYLISKIFFHQISSEWMLERYCEDELEYIAPVQIPLDQTERHGAHFQYIPLEALLSKIAQNHDVWAMLKTC